MSGIGYAFLAFVVWGLLAPFAAKASATHSSSVNVAVEAVVFIVLAAYLMHGSWGKEMGKVTVESGVYALLMGACSALGFCFLMMAFQKSPENISVVALVSGMYPLLTVLIMALLAFALPNFLPEAKPLSGMQWLGVFFGGLGLLFVNWDPAWIPKVRRGLDVLAANLW